MMFFLLPIIPLQFSSSSKESCMVLSWLIGRSSGLQWMEGIVRHGPNSTIYNPFVPSFLDGCKVDGGIEYGDYMADGWTIECNITVLFWWTYTSK